MPFVLKFAHSPNPAKIAAVNGSSYTLRRTSVRYSARENDTGRGVRPMAASQRLRVFMPNRESQGKIIFELANVGPAVDRDGLRLQRCTLPEGEEALHVSVLNGTGRKRLRRQIKIGTHLTLRHSGGTYPPQLSELRGYENEAAIFSYSGRPLTEVELTSAEKADAARDLLAGLRGLGDAQVVHRKIRPDTLLWDGSLLQITDYSLAAVTGSPQAADPVNGAPWCSPEQAAASRPGAPADDLYAAALVLFWLHSGEEPDGDAATMRNRLRLQDPPLPDLLAGCFDAEARRPTLRLLHDRWTPPPPRRAPAHLRRAAKARDDFADLRRRQAADRSPLIDPAAAPAPPGRTVTPPGEDGPPAAPLLSARAVVAMIVVWLGIAAFVLLVVAD